MTSDCFHFDREAHVRFFVTHLQGLPRDYQGQECNALTLAYFAVSALDILDALHLVPSSDVVDWVYSLQVLPLKELDDCADEDLKFGFRGSHSTYISRNGLVSKYDGGHLAMTYSALAILKILGDDCSRVCTNAIVRSMRLLQQPDGSFTPVYLGAERDSRFLFCAAAICAFLQDWRGMDTTLACDYIRKCQSYDGGFGLSPGLEAHGGATYCALAALKLIPQADIKRTGALDFPLLVNWLLQRQAVTGGFEGRINKESDTCYAFWIGASLVILGVYSFCDRDALRLSLLACQLENGGFSKYPNGHPDLLHAYYGITSRTANELVTVSDTVNLPFIKEAVD